MRGALLDLVAVHEPLGDLQDAAADGEVVVAGGDDQVGPGHGAVVVHLVVVDQRASRGLDDAGALELVDARVGTGIIEAPRGALIRHYKVDDNGAMTWANLIVATGHNNLAIGRGVLQVAKRFVNGNKIEEGALNRVSGLVRAYDPCLSCSTHTLGMAAVLLELRGPGGELLDEVATG